MRIRAATVDDIPELDRLIARSARKLSERYYKPEQVEGALTGAFGVDTQLLADRTYFVIEENGALIACGGWSFRRTLFGSDARSERDATQLHPETEAAKIRAFFVDPNHARRGLGKMLLEHCESAAIERGFTTLELMSTMPGKPFYAAMGYVAGEQVDYPVTDGVKIEFVPMTKKVRPK